MGVQVAGITCAVPKRAEDYTVYAPAFGTRDVEKIAKLTGIYTRRIVEEGVCTSDLCTAAAEDLLARLGWARDTIDLLVFVSQTQDYLLPATACCIQSRLGLSTDCAAFDLVQGCTGYIYGLYVASALVSSGSTRRALLLVGDTISRVVSPGDRATVLLFGDAGSATALEYDPLAPPMDFVVGSDGRGRDHLIVPAGGFRKRSTPETRERRLHADGSARSEEDLYMNGSELLAFTMAVVPKLIKETLTLAGRDTSEVDYFVFHQANRFMIEHFARKSGIPLERVPFNLDRYGNTSSASVPLVIASELRDVIAARRQILLLAGFGVGYSCGGAVVEIGPIPTIGLIEV
jgi:3-oxoacyl-[acyl-carrier-protein] synthase-3